MFGFAGVEGDSDVLLAAVAAVSFVLKIWLTVEETNAGPDKFEGGPAFLSVAKPCGTPRSKNMVAV